MKKLMQCYFPKNHRLFIGYASAIALSLFVPLTVNAVPQSNPSLTQLPGLEQTTLKAGRVVLTGEKGHYTGRVLVTAPLNTAWNVLTDYDHFKNFIPGVVSSKILQNNDQQTIFEQINVVKVFLFTQKSRLVIASSKHYPSQIDFQLKSGDIKSLNGIWRLDLISSNQVLITQDVTFDPGSSVPRNLAFSIYKNALADSLKAIKLETERRYAQQ